ncbi:MAG: hypothetical protein AAF957_11195 [Planctomycetota bacterium]
MKQDDDLRDFFAAERTRDRHDLPAFADLVDPSAHRDAPRAPRRRRGRIVWLVTAAAASALVATWLAAPPEITVGPAESIDLDSACDAALAALDEQEDDAHLRLSTDVLLTDDGSSSD